MPDLGLALSALGAGGMQGYNNDVARNAQAAQLAQANQFKQAGIDDAKAKEIDTTLANIPDYDTASAYAKANGRPMGSALAPPAGSALPPLNPYFKGDLTGFNGADRNIVNNTWHTGQIVTAQDRIAANNFKLLMTQAGTPDATQQTLAKSLDANTGSNLYNALWGGGAAQPGTIPPPQPSLPQSQSMDAPNAVGNTGRTTTNLPDPRAQLTTTPQNVPPPTPSLPQMAPSSQGAPGMTGGPVNAPPPTPSIGIPGTPSVNPPVAPYVVPPELTGMAAGAAAGKYGALGINRLAPTASTIAAQQPAPSPVPAAPSVAPSQGVPPPTPALPNASPPVAQNTAQAPSGAPANVPPPTPATPQPAAFQGFGLTPKAQAQVDNLTARSGLATAQTKQIDTLLQPRLDKIGSEIKLNNAETDWKTKLLNPEVQRVAAETAKDLAQTKAIPERLAIAWRTEQDQASLAKSLITYRQGELIDGGTNAQANIDRALAALNTSYNTGIKDQNTADPNSPANQLKQINFDLNNAYKTSRAITMAGTKSTDPSAVAEQNFINNLTAKKNALMQAPTYPTPTGAPPPQPSPYNPMLHGWTLPALKGLTENGAADPKDIGPKLIPSATPSQPSMSRSQQRAAQGRPGAVARPVVGHTMRPVAPTQGQRAPTNANGNQDLGEGHTFDPRTSKVYYNGAWTGKYMHRANR